MPEYVEIISMNLNDPSLRPNDGGYQACEPGTYEFEIEKTATDTSKSGNDTLKVTARVIGPEGSPMIGKKVVNTFVYRSKDASKMVYFRERMLGFIQGIGAPLDQNGNFSRAALDGLRFVADVEKRPINGGATVNALGQAQEGETRMYTQWVRERPIEDAEPQVAAPAAASIPTRRAPAANRPQPPR